MVASRLTVELFRGIFRSGSISAVILGSLIILPVAVGVGLGLISIGL